VARAVPNQPKDKHFWKEAELHLTLFMPSSHRVLIIHSPQTNPKILRKGAGFIDPRGKERKSMFSM
jgi:hypothetical protein